jgi:hypothetical protein
VDRYARGAITGLGCDGGAMRKSIISLILLCCSVAPALAATTDDLVAGAPERYVVVPGDTLWSISGRYLKSPWKWNDLWKLNQEQIRNPNRIYPGDVLVLDRSFNETRLRLLKTQTVKLVPGIIESAREAEPVPTIPTADIEPFLSQPLVIVENQLASAPRIVATQENRVALGAGSIAYAKGVTKEDGQRWQIFRPGAALVDPRTNEALGQEATYLGEAIVTKFGPVSTLEIVKSPLEIYAGDYLLPAPRGMALSSYAPHAPGKKITAQIIAAYGSLFETGSKGIVALSKGAKDGIEVGHVLAIYRNLNASTNRLRESSLWGRQGFAYDPKNPTTNYVNEPLVTRDAPLWGRLGPMGAQYKDDKSAIPVTNLPDERYGLMMVFRVFDRASYALIMNAERPVNILDIATNP